MDTIQIRLTDEEKEEFALLPKEQQQEFMKSAEKRRNHLMLKVMTLSAIMIDSLEEMEQFGLARYRLKQVGRMYMKELDKIVDDVFLQIKEDEPENQQDSAGYIAEVSKAIDKII